jgi:hypothetical protein
MIERNLLDVGGMQRQNDAQPIQDRNNRHFDVSGPYRDRQARLPDLSQPANAAIRLQVQGNLPADAQFIRGNNRPVFDRRAVFDVSRPIRARGSGSMVYATEIGSG